MVVPHPPLWEGQWSGTTRQGLLLQVAQTAGGVLGLSIYSLLAREQTSRAPLHTSRLGQGLAHRA